MKNLFIFVVMGLILSGCNQGNVPVKQHKSVTNSAERFKSPAKKKKPKTTPVDPEGSDDVRKNLFSESDEESDDKTGQQDAPPTDSDDESEDERTTEGNETDHDEQETASFERQGQYDDSGAGEKTGENEEEDTSNNAFTTPKRLKRFRARKPRTPYKNSFTSFELSPENISKFVAGKEKKTFASLTEQERNISACIIAHALSTIDYFNVTKNLCVIRKLAENKSKNINIDTKEAVKNCESFARGSTPAKKYIATQIAPKVRLSFFLKRSLMPISVINTMWDFAQIEEIVQNNLDDVDTLLKEYGALMKNLKSESSVAMKDVINFVEQALKAMTYRYRK